MLVRGFPSYRRGYLLLGALLCTTTTAWATPSSLPEAKAVTTPGLDQLDWLVIAGYVGACLFIGWWAMRHISDAGGYLMARRKLGKVMSLAATFAGGVNANDPVAVTSKVYAQGVSGVWTALNFLIMTPWMWMRDPVGRRLRLVTGIDVLELRFGPVLKWMGLIVGILGGIVNLGLGIKAAAVVAIGVSGGNETLAIISITGDPKQDAMIVATGLVVLPTLIYTVMGGILAACATDIFMSLLIIALSFVVIPFAYNAVGGLEAIRHGLPPGHLDLISASAVSDFTFWGIFWFLVSWTFALGPAPSAAKDEMTARVGSLGLLFKRFCTLGWAAMGLFAVLLYSSKSGLSSEVGDTVFAKMSVDLLPSGLRGVMVAAILAAAMSTIASMSLGFAGTALHNLWRPFIRPSASPKHYLLMARVFTCVGLIIAWVVAVGNKSDIFTYFSNLALIGSLLGVCTLAAYQWRRVTSAGAVASALIMAPPVLFAFFGGELGTPWSPYLDWIRVGWIHWLEVIESCYRMFGITSVSLGRDAGNLVSAPLAIRFPAQLLPGLVALVGVSLFTRQHNARNVEDFYARLDTPVGDEHLLVARGIKVDLLQDLGSDADVTTRDPSRRLLFLDLLYLPWLLARGEVKLSDYKIDLIGVALTSAFVAAFIGGILILIDWLKPVAAVLP